MNVRAGEGPQLHPAHALLCFAFFCFALFCYLYVSCTGIYCKYVKQVGVYKEGAMMLWLSEVQAVCAKRAIKLIAKQLKFVLQCAQQCDSACEVQELVEAAIDCNEPAKAVESTTVIHYQLLAVA